MSRLQWLLLLRSIPYKTYLTGTTLIAFSTRRFIKISFFPLFQFLNVTKNHTTVSKNCYIFHFITCAQLFQLRSRSEIYYYWRDNDKNKRDEKPPKVSIYPMLKTHKAIGNKIKYIQRQTSTRNNNCTVSLIFGLANKPKSQWIKLYMYYLQYERPRIALTTTSWQQRVCKSATSGAFLVEGCRSCWWQFQSILCLIIVSARKFRSHFL